METSESLDIGAELRQNQKNGQTTLPNSGGILTLGILSIIFVGLIGLILAIICLSLSSSANKAVQLNPEKYTQSSIKNAKAGKVCGIIGLSIAGLAVLIFLGAIIVNL